MVDHLKTGHVRFSDPHCIRVLENLKMYCCSTHVPNARFLLFLTTVPPPSTELWKTKGSNSLCLLTKSIDFVSQIYDFFLGQECSGRGRSRQDLQPSIHFKDHQENYDNDKVNFQLFILQLAMSPDFFALHKVSYNKKRLKKKRKKKDVLIKKLNTAWILKQTSLVLKGPNLSNCWMVSYSGCGLNKKLKVRYSVHRLCGWWLE